MVTIRQIRAAAREIARQFRPRRITLFGSYARGNPSKDSDVDLLILMEGRQVHDKALQIRRRIDFGFLLTCWSVRPANCDSGLRGATVSWWKSRRTGRFSMKRLTREWAQKAEGEFHTAQRETRTRNYPITIVLASTLSSA
jgi:hypothetical protein